MEKCARCGLTSLQVHVLSQLRELPLERILVRAERATIAGFNTVEVILPVEFIRQIVAACKADTIPA